MIPAPIPTNEADRLVSLRKMSLLSTPRTDDLDRITRTVRRLFNVEIALVSLIDNNRQWFKSRCGLSATETPRDVSFCGHAIHTDEAFVIEDALEDERFFDNPLVTGSPNVRFYAGHSITNREGFRIGTLCAISTAARTFSASDREALGDLARLTELTIENMILSEAQQELITALDAAERDRLLDPSTGFWNRQGLERLFEGELRRARRDAKPLAILFVGVDSAKSSVDDGLIGVAATALARAAPAQTLVSRYDGSSFALLGEGLSPSMLPALGERILRSFEAQRSSGDARLSVGIAAAVPNDGLTQAALLSAAEEALRQARAAGGGCVKSADHPDMQFSNFALA